MGQKLSSSESFEELRALLVALRDEAPPNLLKVQIWRCLDLDEAIVALFGAQVSNSVRFDSPSAQGRALYVNFYGIYDNDFETMVNFFWDRYENTLSDGLFSRGKDKKWRTFTEGDLTNLKEYCGIQ